MKKNVGGIDRGFRIGLGLLVLAVGISYRSWWGALGLLPLLTGVFAWCPVYVPFRTSTCDEASPPARVGVPR